METLARAAGVLLEVVTVSLLIVLAVVVVLAVGFRFSGASFIWYDEVASVMLAWITYYGAALAALRRRHLGFPGLQFSLGPAGRLALFWIGEAITYLTFATMAWASWFVLRVMAGEALVSLDWVPLQFTQSVVPIGCGLFILASLLSTPAQLRRVRDGRTEEQDEIAEEIARAGDHAARDPESRR